MASPPRQAPPRLRLSTHLLILVLLGAVVAVTTTIPGLRPDAVAGTTGRTAAGAPALGVYMGPGATNVAGAEAFSSWSGSRVDRLVEFLPDATWESMTYVDWALAPYTDSGYELELSVPMLPAQVAGVSLEECAAGRYDEHWVALAQRLLAHRLADTEIRPGWEMNGDVYRWSAAGRPSAYAGCFRSLVQAMRSVDGQRFQFVFSTNIHQHAVAPDLAYPGDAYVDTVSLDVYDTSWTVYPVPGTMTSAAAQLSVWRYLLNGEYGLRWWSAFAAEHDKRFGISEWGVTWRSDGHGGNDDPAFVDRMFDWVLDPANGVDYATYFNNLPTSDPNHELTGPGTRFPLSAARYRARAAAFAPRTTPGSTTPGPAPEPGAVLHTTSVEPGPAPQPAPDRGSPSSAGTLRRLEVPRVSGTARVGQRLAVSTGRWSPAAATVRYQWFRGSRALRGRDAATYRVTRSDVGKRLRVRVTLSRPGYRRAVTWPSVSRVPRR